MKMTEKGIQKIVTRLPHQSDNFCNCIVVIELIGYYMLIQKAIHRMRSYI
jgi:hypothetical protein